MWIFYHWETQNAKLWLKTRIVFLCFPNNERNVSYHYKHCIQPETGGLPSPYKCLVQRGCHLNKERTEIIQASFFFEATLMPDHKINGGAMHKNLQHVTRRGQSRVPLQRKRRGTNKRLVSCSWLDRFESDQSL
jgi:hypothetical protein